MWFELKSSHTTVGRANHKAVVCLDAVFLFCIEHCVHPAAFVRWTVLVAQQIAQIGTNVENC